MPYGDGAALVPFDLWPRQRDVLDRLTADRLLLLLKARQIGMTWLTCGYVLYRCMERAGRTVLLFSQGQLEANELIERIRLMHTTHADADLPALVTDNTTELEWANGSRIKSLPATRKAGRSFTASVVVLDEYAFMTWGPDLLAAVKPTIDNGGQLIILSSADGNGTAFHQLWQAASSGANGFTPLFLDWKANPTRGDDWRDARMTEGVGESDVLREYPANDIEAFTHAAGLIFDTWTDPGNVTDDAEYVEGAGPIFWAVDDGYSAGSASRTAGIDPTTGRYVGDAHPRVFLLVQQRDDGRLCVFAEHYTCLKLSDAHIDEVLAMRPDGADASYPAPDYCVHGPGAAEIRGRFQAAGLYARQSTANVEESIKETRRALAADANGWRRILVHPRCKHLRAEMASYRRDTDGRIVKAFDHGPDALRGLAWVLRWEV
jgi:hypothetical protein